MLIKVLLDSTAEMARKDLGTLDDLPIEVANTIANIYYKYHLSDDDSIEKHQYEIDIDAIQKIIKNMRILRETNPDLYDYSVDFFLDLFKYRIPEANKKSAFRRRIERKLKKVEEIENLADILKFH